MRTQERLSWHVDQPGAASNIIKGLKVIFFLKGTTAVCEWKHTFRRVREHKGAEPVCLQHKANNKGILRTEVLHIFASLGEMKT